MMLNSLTRACSSFGIGAEVARWTLKLESVHLLLEHVKTNQAEYRRFLY